VVESTLWAPHTLPTAKSRQLYGILLIPIAIRTRVLSCSDRAVLALRRPKNGPDIRRLWRARQQQQACLQEQPSIVECKDGVTTTQWRLPSEKCSAS